MEAEQIILLILSGALSVFLILGIIVMVKVLIIIKTLQRLGDRVENVADKAEAVTNIISKASGPAAAARIFAGISELVADHKSKKKR